MVSPRSRAKVRSLGLRIRQLREAAHRSQSWLAGQLGGLISNSAYNRFELGAGWPAHADLAEGVERILLALDVQRDEFLQIMALVRTSASENWLAVGSDVGPQFAAYIEYEAVARRITSLNTVVFPGLIQTRDYAEEIFRGGDVAADEQRERTRIRLWRQQRLDWVHLTVILDEAVLTRRIGDVTTMAEQLELAVALGRRDNIDVHVLPSRQASLVASGGYVLLEFSDQPPLAYSDHAFGGIILDEVNQVTHLMQRTTMVLGSALSTVESAELMNTTLHALTTETGV